MTLLAKDMADIENRIKAFCAGMTPEKKEEFIGIMADYTAWQASRMVHIEIRKRVEEGQRIISANMKTLLS